MQRIALEAHQSAIIVSYSNILVSPVKPIGNLDLDERRRFGNQLNPDEILSMRRFIPLFFILISLEVSAMSFFNPAKTCVFSEVNARLVLNGKPVSGAKVTRQWNWNKKKTDESLTDEQGYVHFPAVFESSAVRLLPAELVVGQQLSVELNGEEKIFWSNGKREPEENAEYGGAPFSVVCELSDEEVLIEEYGSLMVTMCKLEK